MKELAVVIPVYNEEKAIGAVLEKWVAELDRLGIDYTVNPYNDGSKDGSWDVIQAKEKLYPGKIIGHDKANSGHGPTILQGYRDAVDAGYEWVFQVDSDDEMGAEGFAVLWDNRNKYDFLVGTRDRRKQALPRKIISAVSRLSVRLFYGRSIWDVNTPYRLMRVSTFRSVYYEIPSDTFAPNVILSGMAAKLKLRCFETGVPQHDRTTGEVSIKKWKLLKAAMESFFQAVFFAMDQKPGLFSTLLLSGLIAFIPLWETNSFLTFITKRVYAYKDSSVFLTIAREMLRGALPYRDYFDHKGLYLYFLNALGLCTSMAFVEWFFLVLTTLILYRTLLLIVRPRIALLLIFLGVRNKCLMSGNMSEEYLLPAVAFGLFYFVSFIRRNRTVNYLQTVLLGMAFGWMLMLKFNYVSVFLITGVYLLWSMCSTKQYKTLLYVVLCGLIGTMLSLLPGIIFLWKHNLFYWFFDTYFLFNLEYAGEGGGFQISNCLYRLRIFPELLLLPWCSGLVLVAKKKSSRKEDMAIALFIFCILLLDCLFIWSGGRFYEHYLIPSYLVAVISIALVYSHFDSAIQSVLNRLKKHHKSIFGYLVGSFCIVLLFCLGFTMQKHINSMKYTLEYIEKNDSFKKDEKVCALLNQYNNRMIVIGNYCIYYLIYNATPDSRFLFQYPICGISKRIREQFKEEILQKKPQLFLLPRGEVISDYYHGFLSDNYRPLECLNGTLFVRVLENE